MRRPARHASQLKLKHSKRGALIVEAVLAAVIIGVGLGYISRGLGGQLKALSVTGERETVLGLARGVLAEIEAERTAGFVPSRASAGTFDAPDEAYGWRITAVPKEIQGDFQLSEVVVAVQRESGHSSIVELSSLWPTNWVPQEWF